MTFRTFTLLLSVFLITMVLSLWVTHKVSKTVATDKARASPLDDYTKVVLRKSNWVEATIRAVNGKNGRTSCPVWYTSEPIEVYYRYAASADDLERAQWYRYPDVNYYAVGVASYKFRFVRTTTNPVSIHYKMDSRFSKLKRCGYLGSSHHLDNLPSVFDALTDLVGLEPIASRLDSSQTRPPPTNGAPSGFKLFHQSQPQPDQTPSSSTATTAPAELFKSDWQRVQRRLTELGYDAGNADGIVGRKTTQAIAKWQISQGFPETGVLTLPQLGVLFKR